MRKVELRMNENIKYMVIKKLVETNGNKKRAAIKLNCTVRHINRSSTPIYFNYGTSCVVIKSFNGDLFATVNDSVFALNEIPEVQAISENFDTVPEVKAKKIYIPPMNHPWREKLFDSFIEKHKLENVS